MKNLLKINDSVNAIDSQIILIKALAKGQTLKETAEVLNLNYYNLQKRTQLLYRKFGVHSRAALIAKSVKYKIIYNSDVCNKFRKRFIKDFRVTVNSEKFHLDDNLTELEIKYVECAMRGMTKTEIISSLNLLNMNYCNYVISQICRKLNARNITQAAAYAIRLGIVE